VETLKRVKVDRGCVVMLRGSDEQRCSVPTGCWGWGWVVSGDVLVSGWWVVSGEWVGEWWVGEWS
jgi:hypothetical protein